MTKAELEGSLSTLDTLIQVFGVICAIGLVGEVGFGVRHWVLNKQMQRIEASESLAKEAEIAALNAKAAGFRLNIAELQADKEPRVLSPSQQLAIASAIRPFRFDSKEDPEHINLRISSCVGNNESRTLKMMIREVFDKAGFHSSETPESQCVTGQTIREGIVISVCDPRRYLPENTDPATMESFARALRDSLKSVGGIDSSIRHLGPDDHPKIGEPDANVFAYGGISILVANKPKAKITKIP